MERFLTDLGNPSKLANELYFISNYSGEKEELKDVELIDSSYIPIDDPEICCLMKGLQCDSVVNTLRMPRRNKMGVPSIVTLKNGDKVVLKITPITPSAEFVVKEIKGNDTPSQCIGHTTDISFFGTDVFTNEIIIAYVLDSIFKMHKMPSLTVRHLRYSICQELYKTNGVTIMEFASLGNIGKLPQSKKFSEEHMELLKIDNIQNNFDLRVFKKETIFNIVKQITITYDFLNSFDFNHSNSKINNVLAFDQPIQLNYKGVNVDCNFTIKLTDFDKAGLTINATNTEKSNFIRFYSISPLAKMYFELFPYTPKVGKTEDVNYYKVGTSFSQQLYKQSRHTGLPFYKSYDLYTFMVSFLMMPEVFYQVFSDSELQSKIWEPLWFTEDSHDIFFKIRNAVENDKEPSFKNVNDIISNKKLKCNLSDILLENLK